MKWRRSRQQPHPFTVHRSVLIFSLLVLTGSCIRGLSYFLNLGVSPYLRVPLEQCPPFLEKLNHSASEYDQMPETLSQMLSSVEQIFILGKSRCSISLPKILADRALCVIGEVLDGCAPAHLISGPHQHAMKVSFTHAAVLQISSDNEYEHILVIEDDIKFIQKAYSFDQVHNFSKLMRSSGWSLIRLGFRPYFLQVGGVEPCPSVCRCFISPAYGNNLCELRHQGCDLRSSDFYIISKPNFLKLALQTIDVRKTNERRIIDVYPMRSLDKQWLYLPQISYQSTLDIPPDYQVGSGALYMKKCARPRPLPKGLDEQQMFV